MENYFSIGEVAKLKGISIKALRYYDAIGLLKPRYVNPETGYRYYSLDQFFIIEMIGYHKDLGIPMKSIKSLFEKNDTDLFLKSLSVQRQEALSQVLHLNKIIGKMYRMEKQIIDSRHLLLERDLYWRELDERRVLIYDCTTRPTEKDTYLKYFDIYKEVTRHNLITIYETGSVIKIPPEENSLQYERIFIIVSYAEDSIPIDTETLPKGRYLCVNYYANNREVQLKKLKQYIGQNDLHPILMVEVDTFVDMLDYSNPLMELQVIF